MNNITDHLYDMLSDDILHHGLLAQIVEREHSAVAWMSVLFELLTRDVEIGSTSLIDSSYVEFTAWKGDINDRMKRAIESVEGMAIQDREYAYWLALRRNVDKYE
jgi:hypothetical protein